MKLGDLDIYNDAPPVEIRRRVGMVFQRPNPFPTMSIFDNVATGLRLGGITKRRRLDEIAERSLRRAALWDEVKDVWKSKSAAAYPAASNSGFASRGLWRLTERYC